MTYDAYKVTKAFERLFRSCRLPLTNPNDPEEAKSLAADYYAACEGYTTGAIVDTCEDFLFGRVESINRTWAPNIPQFASRLRYVQSHLNGPRSLHKAAVKQLEQRDRDAEIEATRTPESMARVKSMAQAFAQSVNPDKRTDAEIAQIKESTRKADVYFAEDYIEPAGVRVSQTLAKKLGYETFNSADDDQFPMGDMK